jgi:hypothetical protein
MRFLTPSLLTLAGLLLAAPAPLRAQRYVWLVPGTEGESFRGVVWDRATGAILAAQGDAIVRIDPLTGRREPVARIGWEEPEAWEEPVKLDALAAAPDGSLVVSDRGISSGDQGGRILRLEAGGRVTTLAGSDTHEPYYSGDRKDARQADFALNGLAVGPGGQVFLADNVAGRVYRIAPAAGAADGKAHCSLQAIAGDGGDAFAEAGAAVRPFRADDARQVTLTPVGVAVDPRPSAGGVRLAMVEEDKARVSLLTAAPGKEDGVWSWSVLPVAGRLSAGDHTEDWPFALAWAPDGTLIVLTKHHLWSLTPAGGDAPWRSACLAGSLATEQDSAADGGPKHPPSGTPAAEFPLHGFFSLAPVPGGGVLLTDGRDDGGGKAGIRFLGPERDPFMDYVVAYRAAVAAQNPKKAQAILAELAGFAEAGVAPAWLCEIPFKRLCHSGELRPHLPEDLRLHIGSFLVGGRVTRFYAVLALRMVRTDPGPDHPDGPGGGAAPSINGRGGSLQP